MTTHDEDKIIAQQARIEQLTNFIKYAQVSSGVCCCGDSMEGHPSPMTCGHSPVDMWDYHSGELLEAYPDDLSALRAHDEKLRAVFQAGAASRDAEIAELVAALERMRHIGRHMPGPLTCDDGTRWHPSEILALVEDVERLRDVRSQDWRNEMTTEQRKMPLPEIPK